jgi:hypothetical protein
LEHRNSLLLWFQHIYQVTHASNIQVKLKPWMRAVVIIWTYLCNRFISSLKVVSFHPIHSEVYLIQHYVIKLISEVTENFYVPWS